MSTSRDPQQGPVYGREGAYATHPATDPAVPPAVASGPAVPPSGPAAPPPPFGAPQHDGPPPFGTPQHDGPPPGAPLPQGYPAPGASGRYLPRNDLAVWSLVLGLLGVMGCLFLTGVPAVIVGNNARRAVAAGQADNDGMATAGIVLGWVATALGVLALLAVAFLTILPLVLMGIAVPFLGTGG
ncbi:DUF4190 domain-containing protein [Cellulomonas sp. Sa3CUA2]|uniref:DUF4190 domain-containing protein n=1 Tax=Cellulomonas avistercoris TaxID=2762242 RepID=A0ABR8Q9B2_9CELL|nr:DUF4190 domain-containing protein [Cellulomonas avistercoris]MBD7917008.1 DUF4190 domain-containing protein [Cellulomonas avistercoris]